MCDGGNAGERGDKQVEDGIKLLPSCLHIKSSLGSAGVWHCLDHLCGSHVRAIFWGTTQIDDVGSADVFVSLDLVVTLAERSRKPYYMRNLRKSKMRQSRVAGRSTADKQFTEDIAEHNAIVSVSAGRLGEGVLCHQCREPIRGVMCYRVSGQPLHWACAGCPKPEPLQETVEELKPTRVQDPRGKPRVSRVPRESVRKNLHTPLNSKDPRCCIRIGWHSLKSFLALHAAEEMRRAGVEASCGFPMVDRGVKSTYENLVQTTSERPKREAIEAIGDAQAKKVASDVLAWVICFLLAWLILATECSHLRSLIGSVLWEFSHFVALQIILRSDLLIWSSFCLVRQLLFGNAWSALPICVPIMKERSALLISSFLLSRRVFGQTCQICLRSALLIWLSFRLVCLLAFRNPWSALPICVPIKIEFMQNPNLWSALLISSFCRSGWIFGRACQFCLQSALLILDNPMALRVLVFALCITCTAGTGLLQEDIDTLLSFSRPSQLQQPSAINMAGSGAFSADEFDFVPPLILAVLCSLVPNAARLNRVLRQDWVKEWHGWQEAAPALEDDDIAQRAALSSIQDFARISLQNVNVVGKSDAVRRAELQQGGKRIGTGMVHGNNECCADSLLQLLALHKYANASLSFDCVARREACRACRAHLVNNVNEELHPKQRTDVGAVADVSDAEHNRTFFGTRHTQR